MEQPLALFPLNTVLFPGASLPLHIFEERYKLMIGRCIALKEPFGVVLIREGVEVGGGAEPYDVGTMAVITNAMRFEDGQMFVIATGGTRFRIERILQQAPYLVASVELIAEEAEIEQQIQADQLHALYEQYRRAADHATGVPQSLPEMPRDALGISFQLSAQLQVPYMSKQQLLEADLETRLEALTEALNDELRLLPPPLDAPIQPDNTLSLN